MPTQLEIENAVTTVLDRRASEAQARQRELDCAAAQRARQDAEQATALAKAQRESELAKLTVLENQRDNLSARIKETVAHYRALPDAICALERDFAVCLTQIQQQKLRLGLAH